MLAALVQEGLRAQVVDARQVVITDESFCGASPIVEDTAARARLHVKPLLDTGLVPVLGGYMGATRQGVTTTLGRGGADGTAALVGALLGAEEIQIWSEVDGMTTVDPRISVKAKPIPEVSPEEAAELAYFGPKVLHPVMILPAIEKGIPVRVLNTSDPDSPGTLVSAKENLGPSGPCAVACRRGITVILLSQPRMLMASGFLTRVFGVFERNHTPVDLVATSEVSISLTIDNVEHLPAIKAELAALGEVRILREMAIVALDRPRLLPPPGAVAADLRGPRRHQRRHDLLRGLRRERLGGRRRGRHRARRPRAPSRVLPGAGLSRSRSDRSCADRPAGLVVRP